MKDFEPIYLENKQQLEDAITRYGRAFKDASVILSENEISASILHDLNEENGEIISEEKIEKIVAKIHNLLHQDLREVLPDSLIWRLDSSYYDFLKEVEVVMHQVGPDHMLFHLLSPNQIRPSLSFISIPHGHAFVLSMMSGFSLTKYVLHVVELFSKFSASNKEKLLLDYAEQYLDGGVVPFLLKCRDFAINAALGDYSLLDPAIRMCIRMKSVRFIGTTPSIDLFDMIPAADLAYKLLPYKMTPKKIDKQYKGVKIHVNNGSIPCRFSLCKGLTGYSAYDDKRKEYVLAFRGTETIINWFTDLHQAIFGADITYLLAIGLLDRLCSQYPGKPICVVGHSLGGGLAQFATLAVANNNVSCYCYNSAGLSDKSFNNLLNYPKAQNSIHHLHVQRDIVFQLGNQFGDYVEVPYTRSPLPAHSMLTIRIETQNHKTYWV